MKVQSIHLKHFKKFRDKKVSFTNPDTGLAKDLIVLIGSNGSGKSTILQTIAAMLGTATRQLAQPADLDWPGFNLEMADKSWQLPGQVELQVEFGQDELDATREFARKVPGLSNKNITDPGNSTSIKMMLQDGQVAIGKNTKPEQFQFRGREYAKQIQKFVPASAAFKRVGGVFWYTEIRNATSLMPFSDEDKTTFEILRSRLIFLSVFHKDILDGRMSLRPEQRDVYGSLEQAYKAIFPNRSFEGSVPQTEIGQLLDTPRFYLYDGKRQYELSEMSGGERAIFPLIFDFANWEIHNSVILIDEIELHLHPPMQQGLLRALKHLGQNNQFIITTHSDAVESIVSEDAIIRLEEGD
ncbi:MAG: AAA family ATPase [Anaerolineales bacterium]